MVPTLGGVHKIQILIRDLLKECLQKNFGEEMGGVQGDPDPLIKSYMSRFACSSPIGGPKNKNKKTN